MHVRHFVCEQRLFQPMNICQLQYVCYAGPDERMRRWRRRIVVKFFSKTAPLKAHKPRPDR